MVAPTEVSLLLFRFSGALYGVAAEDVLQVVWRPEITPVDEVEPFHLGVFNLQGQAVEVVELNLRLGHPPGPCNTSDCIIILTLSRGLVGVTAHEILEVTELPLLQRQVEDEESTSPLVVANGEYRGDLVMVLAGERLLPSHPFNPMELNHRPHHCSELEPAQHQLLKARSEHYRDARLADSEEKDTPQVVIVVVAGEYFGLQLDRGVREFAHLSQWTPIPCTPPQVVGNMNLRGDIVTLFDITWTIGLRSPSTGADGEEGEGRNVVVYQIDGLLLGVVVDVIEDVVRVGLSGLRSTPAALMGSNKGYSRGEFLYDDVMVTLLDFPMMVQQGVLTVDERVA